MPCYVFDLDDTLILHHNDINYDWIYEDIELSYYLDMCKGDKYIFTNGTKSHAKKILEKMVLGTLNFSESISLAASCVGCVKRPVQPMRFN